MSTSVTLPYDPCWLALTWAKRYCPSYITNQADPSGKIVYYFGKAQDALVFSLKWI